jgi:hypothetical protein
VIGYRRWFRWQTLPISDIEEIRSGIWTFGIVKLAGHSKKLRFFLEPENRHLLGFKATSGESLQVRMNPPEPGTEVRRPILDVLIGATGLAFATIRLPFFPALPIVEPGPSGPSWIDRIVSFEARYSTILIAVVIFALVARIREKDLRGLERRVMVFLLGGAVGSLLKGMLSSLTSQPPR